GATNSSPAHGPAPNPPPPAKPARGGWPLKLDPRGGRVPQARVDRGEPILEASRIPTTLAGNPPVDVPLTVDDRTFRVTCVSMGNPHCVTFVDAIDDKLVHGIGPRVERHPAFPRRTNAEFVRVVKPDEVTVRVWERGSAETLACGTGACAVAVAGVLTGRTQRGIVAHLPGGDLHLFWS